MSQTLQIANLNPSNFTEEIIALDTNVLYWFFYATGLTYNKPSTLNKLQSYGQFIQDLISNDAFLVTTTININELMHLIEKNEFKLYCYFNNKNINFKDYKRITTERNKLCSLCQMIYLQIKQIIYVANIQFNDKLIDNYINSIKNYRLDCLDYVLLNYCLNENINYILTDDKDFEGYNINCDVIKM